MKVIENQLVFTEHSVFLVEPIDVSGVSGYRVTKKEDSSREDKTGFPVGWQHEGTDLFLAVGCCMRLGDFATSVVKRITCVEPHH
ncbi:MAG: hypothetical protein M0P64_00895 [Candidatus Pacebacteria bacterium]|nr:hypothetical protein [Candidatus Paceibacterota bacterium]